MRSLIPLLLILSFPISAQIYKWTDENGTVHFGSQPPPGQKQEVKIRDSQPSSSTTNSPVESDIIRQSRELERLEAKEAVRDAEERYRERVSEIREDYENRPDYICQGAENRLQSARERWENQKKQGYSISDERYYEQLIKDRERHRDTVCR